EHDSISQHERAVADLRKGVRKQIACLRPDERAPTAPHDLDADAAPFPFDVPDSKVAFGRLSAESRVERRRSMERIGSASAVVSAVGTREIREKLLRRFPGSREPIASTNGSRPVTSESAASRVRCSTSDR